MNELVELVRTSADAGWLVFCGVALAALGFYALDRRPRASSARPEAAEETTATTRRRAA